MAAGAVLRLLRPFATAGETEAGHYRPEIDGLRAIAVLSVIVYHLSPLKLSGGFLGVDIFFVISGYLITSIIDREFAQRSFSLVSFYARRARRIFPALLLMLVATLVMGWFCSLPADYATLGQHVAGGSVFLSNILLWSQTGYFEQDSSKQILLHLWSLGIEEQFYLFWPLVLSLTLGARRIRPLVVLGIAIASLGVGLWLSQKGDNNGAFYLPFSRVWELMVGGLVALHMPRLTRLRQRFSAPVQAGAAAVGLALIAASLLLVDNARAFSNLFAIPPVIGAALLIALGNANLVSRWIVSNRVLVLVGLISYPLYLWHWPPLAFIASSNIESATVLRAAKVGAIVFTIGAAIATYLFVERPLRRLPLLKTAGVLAAVLALVGGCGLAVFCAQGVPQRFSATDRQILDDIRQQKAAFGPNVRSGLCFLEDNATRVDARCRGDHPAIILWGDSHAAHLYPGLKQRVANPERTIAQFTGGNCLPLFDQGFIHESRCTRVTKAMVDALSAEKPKYIIVSAFWRLHQDEAGLDAALIQTLGRLKSTGASVILIGPDVAFPNPQGRYLLGRQASALNARDTMLPRLRQIDARLRGIADQTGVSYLSPISVLCPDLDCRLAAWDRGQRRLLAYDYGHLTQTGSNLYAGLLMPLLPGVSSPER